MEGSRLNRQGKRELRWRAVLAGGGYGSKMEASAKFAIEEFVDKACGVRTRARIDVRTGVRTGVRAGVRAGVQIGIREDGSVAGNIDVQAGVQPSVQTDILTGVQTGGAYR